MAHRRRTRRRRRRMASFPTKLSSRKSGCRQSEKGIICYLLSWRLVLQFAVSLSREGGCRNAINQYLAVINRDRIRLL